LKKFSRALIRTTLDWFDDYAATSPFFNSASTSQRRSMAESDYLLRIDRRNNFLLSVVATAADVHEKHCEKITLDLFV
jgi:hypothetical protein